MKKYLFLIMVLGVLSSCTKEEKKIDVYSPKEIVNNQKYQTEIYQVDGSSDYTVVILNRFNGKVHIGKNASGWYEATNTDDLVAYKTPVYSIKVFRGVDMNPQIALFNEKTGELYMYIVGHTANFYGASYPNL